MGSVDVNVNKPHLLPPTPGEIDKLVEKLHSMQRQPVTEELSSANYRRLHRRFSKSEVQTLVARYEAGESVSNLSRELNTTRQALRSLLTDEGVSLRRRGMLQADADKAVQLYEGGLTIDEVVNRVGYSYGVVNRMLHKRGVKVRPRRHQE